MTGQSSADPDQLDGWARASRGLDEPLTRQQRGLEGLHDQFSASSRWGSFDATRLIGSLRTYIGHNETDAQWTSTISEAFRQADSAGGLTSPGGVMRLPDTVIGAALTKAGLMTARPPEVPLGQRDPGLRSTEADRQAFRNRDRVFRYESMAEYVRKVAAKHPVFRGIPEDLAGIHSFTLSSWFAKANRALREGDTNALEEYRAEIRVTTSGLNQLPAYEGTVYRTVSSDTPGELETILARYKRGTIVTERQFLSSHKYPAVGQITFIIRSRTGRDIELISNSPNEAEVLFAPGTRFHVIGDPVRVPVGDRGGYRWEITLDEVE